MDSGFSSSPSRKRTWSQRQSHPIFQLTRNVRPRMQVAMRLGSGVASRYAARGLAGLYRSRALRSLRGVRAAAGRVYRVGNMAQMARSAYQAFNRFAGRRPPPRKRTTGKPITKHIGTLSRTAQYGGKFRTPKPVKYGLAYKCDTQGITFVQEVGGTDATGSYCCTIGHATHSQDILERLLYGSIVRLVMNRIQYAGNNFAQGNSLVRAGDVVRICYRLNFDNTPIAEQFISYPCANDDSMTNIVTGLIAQARILANKTAQLNFLYAQYLGASDAVDSSTIRVNLQGARVTLYGNSTLTVQNRTDNGEANPTSDEIDAIPLVGKVYEGYGSGGKLKWDPTAAGVTDLHQNPVAQANGLILYTEGTATTLREPLAPWAYSNVQKTNSVKMASGNIKDSKLYHSGTISLQKLISTVYAVGSASKFYTNFGKYKFYMLEKHIEATSGAPVYPLRIAYQINNKCGAFITVSKAKAAVQENFIGQNLP